MKILPKFFVIRSDDLPREDMLTGYFFDGADLYVDRSFEDGAKPGYSGRLPYDLDGIYVAVEAGEGRIRITADYAGTVPLFLYRSPGFWAVSPSFKKLLDLARSRGEQLDLVPDVFQAWRIAGTVGQFPRNFQTCVAQVQLVPTYCDLIGDAHAVTLTPRERKASPDYATSLNLYRHETGARFRTIVENGGHLILDLTGGIDSRAIFATAWEAFDDAEFRDLTRTGRISLRTNPSQKVDRAIAEEIVRKLGIELEASHLRAMVDQTGGQKSRPTGAQDTRGDAAENGQLYQRWKEERVGRWAILGVDQQQWDTRTFASSGVFGGNLKSPNEGEITIEDGRHYLEKLRKRFDDDAVFEQWRDRVIADVTETQKWTGGDRLPFWPIFNREFVMRLHAGQSLGSHRLYPLASRHLSEAVNHLDSAQLAAFKVHHDLIFASSGALYEIAYDKDYKNPRKGFTPATLPAFDRSAAEAQPGQLLAADLDLSSNRGDDDDILYPIVRERALELAQRRDIRKLLGRKYCDKVIATVSEFPQDNRRGLPFFKLSLLHGPHLAEMMIDAGLSAARTRGALGRAGKEKRKKLGDRLRKTRS